MRMLSIEHKRIASIDVVINPLFFSVYSSMGYEMLEKKSLEVEQLKNIRAIVCDVDGVLTNGQIFLAAGGEWRRFFNIIDGMGLKLMQRAGLAIGVITTSDVNDIRQRNRIFLRLSNHNIPNLLFETIHILRHILRSLVDCTKRLRSAVADFAI